MMAKKLGILGGGQLGLMILQASENLDVEIHFLDPNPECSVAQFTEHLTVGDFTDYDTVVKFGQTVDVVTIEIEHVNVEALETLEAMGKTVNPSSRVLRTIQDKGLQKTFYQQHDLPTSDFRLVSSPEAITEFPIVQKARTGGYDGKGVQVLKSAADLDKAFPGPSVLEDLVDIELEVGVIVARNAQGEVVVFPPVDMEFDPELNLVKYVLCPSVIDENMNKKCVQIAQDLATKLDLVGILAVEYFITKDGKVLINEAAPRVHNSGHLTIEGTTTSQFEMHVRAVMGLDLPTVEVTEPSVMVNLIGTAQGFPQIINENVLHDMPQSYMHWYEKAEVRPGRKMGHMTVLATTRDEARAKAEVLADEVTVGAREE